MSHQYTKKNKEAEQGVECPVKQREGIYSALQRPLGDKSKERDAQCPDRPEFYLRFVCNLKTWKDGLAV